MAEYKDLAERTIATFIQAAIGAMGTNSVMDLGVDNWKMIVAAGVSAAVAAVSYTHLTLPTILLV